MTLSAGNSGEAAIVVTGAPVNFWEVATVIAVGVLVWAVSTFVIRRVSRRIAKGLSFLKKDHFRWVAPALQALESQRREQRARTIGSLLNSVVTVVITVIVIFYVLQALGVNIAPLLASVGVVGIAIGFGSQQLIRDYLAGIFISLEDQYGIGDHIVTSEVEGTVKAVGLRITKVEATDGTIWYLRNGEIMRVGNRSQGTYVPPVEATETEETEEGAQS
ncbi:MULTISPECIES: mechanosensitive ion channel domain-containing protein [Arthrobacter]|uniref:Mechanosensitive ion channel domain-containing protein n=2 Tax=Arthrobacter TaxID=1663 RepID=A0ABU9KJ81_9MICC|nr:mechanosensitive ion channel domain-containing protein [Arthrobacter sp. YJM1]MDP5225643.1 mechanosensitive ion channel [Arthrobacter sp. YJM1]